MFFTLLLACTSSDIRSCNVAANVKHMYQTEEACLVDAQKAIDIFSEAGIFAKVGCIKLENVGTNA